MILDTLGQLLGMLQAMLISIPLENPLSYLYVILDLLSKLWVAGNAPAGGTSDVLPF